MDVVIVVQVLGWQLAINRANGIRMKSALEAFWQYKAAALTRLFPINSVLSVFLLNSIIIVCIVFLSCKSGLGPPVQICGCSDCCASVRLATGY